MLMEQESANFSHLKQGLYSFELFKFSVTLGLVVTFKNFHNFPSLGVFFDLK